MSSTSRTRALVLGLLAVSVAALPAGTASAAPPPSPAFGPAIERFAAFEGQTTCVQAATPGAVALQDLVTRAYPQFGHGHLLRPCGQGGASEHKDGRAWDWVVNAGRPDEKAAADELLAWLTATDEFGNPAARLRRMGIMYVIWNGSIFKAYDRAPGWYPYTGASPHTDHVHFSLGWSGARQGTSWWQRTWAPAPGVTGRGDGLHVVTQSVTGTPVARDWTAGAGFGSAASLDGHVVGGLAATTLPDGGVVLAGRGTDDRLYTNRRDASGRWAGWVGHGGVLSSRPSVATRPDGGVDVAVRGSDGQVWLRSSAGSAWADWVPLGGSLSADAAPAIVHAGDRLHLVVVGTDDAPRLRTRTGSAWGTWRVLDGAARGDVAAAAAADGTLVIAVRGSDDAGWVRSLGAVDSGWRYLGGVLSSPPSMTASVDRSRQHVVVKGTDDRLYGAVRDASGWSSWSPLG